MAVVDVRLDAVAIERLLRSEDGPVARHLMTVGDEVKHRARGRVGVSDPAQRMTRSGGAQHLRDAIVKRLVSDSRGFAVWVGAELDHAHLHHEGTDAHPIEPVRAKALRFRGPGGMVIFATRVEHPGTRPNRYLTDAAEDVGLTVHR